MRTPHPAGPWPHRLLHGLSYLLGLGVIVVMGITLFLRLVLIPEIDRYRPDIEQLASRNLGMPVHIGAVSGHWQGLHPHFKLAGLTVTGPDGRPHLSLAEVRATLSWSSLLFMDLRLANLELRDLDLLARRDPAGVIYVAGMPVNSPGQSSPFPDWLLRQHNVLLMNGQVLWQDDLIKAPPLKITQINARMENLLGRHQMGVKGQLPSGLGERLDLRAELRGHRLSDAASWHGEIYMAVDNTQLDTLARHAPWSQSFVQAGTGHVRAWIDLKKGRLAAVTGDVHLADTRLRFDEALPDTLFTSLRGRIMWRSEGPHEELSARGLTFTTPSQSASEPADLRLRIKRTPDQQRIESGELETRNLRIETFTTLTGHIPMPRSIHDQIQSLAPRGQITHASGQWNGSDKYRLKAHFSDIGIKATAKQPGFQGASGHLEANENGGSLVLDTNVFTLDAPKAFRYPLQFKRVEGAAQWRNQADQHEIHIKRLELLNDDLEGQLQGRLIWKPGRSPVADLKAQIKHARGDAVWRYLPEAVGDDTRFWLRDSLKAGVSRNAQMRLKGPLDRFPFTHGGGEFRVSVPLEDAKLLYAEHWPSIDHIQGDLVFDRAAMHLKATGRSAGTQLSEVTVSIADLFQVPTLLEVQGRAQGETRAFIDFVNHSPVKAHTGGFTEHLVARGQASLDLKLRLPLEKMTDSKVEGSLTLKDNQVSPGLGLPDLEQLNGSLRFTQDQLSGRDLTARLFGEPARLSITPRNSGTLAVQVQSQLTRKLLAAWLPAEFLTRLQGQTTYQLELLADTRQQRLKFTSDLEGLAIQLPAPLGKAAALRAPLRIESAPKEMGFNALEAQYGNIATLRALYKSDLASARIGLRLGPGEATLPAANGVEISGSMGRLDLDQWRALAASMPDTGDGKGSRLPLRSIHIQSAELQIMDRTLHGSTIDLKPNGQGWLIALKSREADGGIMIVASKRHIIADFARLHWPDTTESPAPAAPTASAATDYSGTVIVKDLQVGKAKLGEVSFNYKSIMGGKEIDRIKVSQPNATLTGRLKLYDDPRRQSVFEDGELQIENLGRLMDRLGYPERVKGGSGSITSQRLAWPGGLDRLSPNALSGQFTIQIKNGQFLEVDPGIARLFAIVNLQAISRLAALDFGTLFSKGFAFDQLDARAQASLGQIKLDLFEMNGTPAKVSMTGQINLNNETQVLDLKVEPHFTDTLVAASGLAAGPVGLAGAWIASKILKDEINRATPRFHYLVTGTWDKPVITTKTPPKETKPTPSDDLFP